MDGYIEDMTRNLQDYQNENRILNVEIIRLAMQIGRLKRAGLEAIEIAHMHVAISEDGEKLLELERLFKEKNDG